MIPKKERTEVPKRVWVAIESKNTYIQFSLDKKWSPLYTYSNRTQIIQAGNAVDDIHTLHQVAIARVYRFGLQVEIASENTYVSCSLDHKCSLSYT